MKRLRQAAEAGDTYDLYDTILEEEEDILSRIDEAEFVDTPLHIAANKGHADFAKAMMYLKPSFRRKMNRNIYSPMHLALQNGHREVVLDLLAADKDLVRVKGREGYTALHYAAEKGDLDLLAQFLKDCPACVEDVTIRNETALHLAVKSYNFEAVEILARHLRRTHLYCKESKSHLLNSKDRNGNTALHIAAVNIQPQMMKVLMECRVDKKEINNQGFTASDLLEMQTSQTDNREICLNIIREAPKEISALQTYFLIQRVLSKEAITCFKAFSNHKKEVEPALLSEMLRSNITKLEESAMLRFRRIGNDMSAENINALLVVVTLILTATYQAMLNPPGGVWQGEYHAKNHVGESVTDSSFYTLFSIVNLEVFAISLILTVMLLFAVTKSRIVTITVEVLLFSLLWCVCEALLVIKPKSSGAIVKSESLRVQILTFVAVVFSLIVIQFLKGVYSRLLNDSHIRFFQDFFRQDMNLYSSIML